MNKIFYQEGGWGAEIGNLRESLYSMNGKCQMQLILTKLLYATFVTLNVYFTTVLSPSIDCVAMFLYWQMLESEKCSHYRLQIGQPKHCVHQIGHIQLRRGICRPLH